MTRQTTILIEDERKSVQITKSTDRQIEYLEERGFGGFTDIVRLAIDRMWREEKQEEKEGRMFVTRKFDEAQEEKAKRNKPIWKHGDGSFVVATEEEMITAAEYQAAASNVDESIEDILDQWTEIE